MSDVSIGLDLDAKQLYQELQTVTAKFVSFAQQTKSEGEKAGAGFSSGFQLGGLGKNLTEGIAALGLESKIHEVVEYGAKVQDLADRFGVSATSIQKFGNAAALHGSSLEGVAKAFRFLEVNQSKALGGNDAMIKSFQALGVSADDLRAKTPDEIMLAIGKSSLNAADLVKVLGKSALELRPTLAGLADGTIQFGNAIDDVDIARLKEVDDVFGRLHQTVTIGLGTAIGSFFGNLQASIAEFVSRAFAAVEELGGIKDAIERLLHGDFKGAGKALSTSRDNANNYIEQGKKEAEELRHPGDEKKRNFAHPEDADTGAGKTDDEGRENKRAESKLERDKERLKDVERQNHLDSLKPTDRKAELQAEAQKELAIANDLSKSEQDRVDAKLSYYDIFKEIERTEKEIERDAKQSDREREHSAGTRKSSSGGSAKASDDRYKQSLQDIAKHGGAVGDADKAKNAIEEERYAKQDARSGNLAGAAYHQAKADAIKNSIVTLKDSEKSRAFGDALDKSKVLQQIAKNTADGGTNG